MKEIITYYKDKIEVSEILTKFLIITETIINILWYSLIFVIKNKKL